MQAKQLSAFVMAANQGAKAKGIRRALRTLRSGWWCGCEVKPRWRALSWRGGPGQLQTLASISERCHWSKSKDRGLGRGMGSAMMCLARRDRRLSSWGRSCIQNRPIRARCVSDLEGVSGGPIAGSFGAKES